MVIKTETIEKVREIIERGYNRLAIALVGRNNVPEAIKEQFPNLDSRSLLEAAYYHNYLNEEGKDGNPSSFEEMKDQQDRPGALPFGNAHEASTDFLNSNLFQLVQKHKADIEAQIIGTIRDNNARYKNDALQNLDRDEALDAIAKESTIAGLKRRLAEYMEKAGTSDWARIVNTEISSAIGQGSVDQIVARNKASDPGDVYVYRINPEDSKTCKYCRRFYIDGDGTPKVYKLSTILSNGTNYGKKADGWKAVAGATHPNCRDSQLIELRPGWAVRPGGTVTFVGFEDWANYIHSKVSS